MLQQRAFNSNSLSTGSGTKCFSLWFRMRYPLNVQDHVHSEVEHKLFLFISLDCRSLHVLIFNVKKNAEPFSEPFTVFFFFGAVSVQF